MHDNSSFRNRFLTTKETISYIKSVSVSTGRVFRTSGKNHPVSNGICFPFKRNMQVSTGQNIFSLSFDDTILIFENINENNNESIFQNVTLNWYKELHDKYGVVISCYCYYEDGDFNLSKMTDKYREQFENNSDWLRFEFHTIDGNTNYQTGDITADYQKTV